ncbi:immunoglobulin superfamily member 10 isoform X2 [Triplophysa rosa]|uniref:immunoglobulin superfamily member 10 isoform X2 n=1 Tax=Triplophysa rosa TaxID=992332 RepID=UPI002545C7A8|nr:immunoglobulin superfamily member 10 isoform X2 [Triplophysa rosa]
MCDSKPKSSLLWRFVPFLCVWASITQRSSSCPKSCACYAPTEVHCTFRYLSEIPRDIQPAVKRINLGYNSITALKVNDLLGLKHLDLLMLHSNVIKIIEDNSFYKLTSLQVLKMGYNHVEKLDKNTFRGLDNLVRLHMDHNHITFIHPESFYELKMLQLVNLEGNMLQQLHPDTFISLRYSQIYKLSTLKTIYLSDNSLTTLSASVLAGCYKIENLFLSGNPWSCDCRMSWLVYWIKKNPGVLKCKRDRTIVKEDLCPVCEIPVSSRGRSIVHLPDDGYTCMRPWIHPYLKQRNVTLGEDDYISVSPKDFVAPIGMLEINVTDQFHNVASIACVVQRPVGMDNLTVTYGVNGKDVRALSATVSTSLVCSIDNDNLNQIWNIFAIYSESPMKLERGLSLSLQSDTVYTYKQTAPTADDVFTEIEAKIKANPAWLMQGMISLQLDRMTTTFQSLNIKYFSNVQIDVKSSKNSRDQYGWTMIRRDNQTKTEHSVLAGRLVELNCQIFGDPKPTTEWSLPDGSKIHAPYHSEDQRIVATNTGRLTLRSVESSDTGVYHCIATNFLDADILAFRVTVLSPHSKEEEVNGVQISQTVGQNVFLDCTSSSSPQASVQWILPDQTVLEKSFGNRKLHRNGSLEIRGLTLQDAGFYRCLAANYLGADLIASQVMVFDDLSTSTKQSEIQTVVHTVGDSQKHSSRYHPHIVSEDSMSIISDRPYTRFHKAPTFRRGNRRTRVMARRVFNKGTKTADTQSFATFIKNSENKRGNEDETLTDVPEDSDMISGDGVSDEFAVTTTQTLGHKTVSNINTTGFTFLNTNDITVNSFMKEEANNVNGILKTKEKLFTATSYPYSHSQTTPIVSSYTPMYDGAPKKDYVLNHSNGSPYIHEREINRHSGEPLTVHTVTEDTDKTELLLSGDSEEVAAGATPSYNFQIPNVTHLQSESQTIFTAVTTTDREQDKITFHTTQRITSRHLLPGSTIISKHQIQIVPPKKSQPGNRRNFPGKRRIIRPSKISDIQSLLDKFKHLSVNKGDNLTLPDTVEQISDCDEEGRFKAGVSAEKCKTTVDQSLVSPTTSYHIPLEKRVLTIPGTHRSTSPKTNAVIESQKSATNLHPILKEPQYYKNDVYVEEIELTKDANVLLSMPITTTKFPKITQENVKELSTVQEHMTASAAKPDRVSDAVSSEDLQLPHIIGSPPMTKAKNILETSTDDASGSSSYLEPDTSYKVIPLSATRFPALHELSIPTESTPASNTLAAPPTMKTDVKQFFYRDRLSGSHTRLWGNQKPGFKGRGQVKTLTTPQASITEVTDKSSTKSTIIASHSQNRRVGVGPLPTPFKVGETLPAINADSEAWRNSIMYFTNLPEFTTLTTEAASTYRRHTVIGLHTTPQSQIQRNTNAIPVNINMRLKAERGLRFTTKRPHMSVQPTVYDQTYKDCFECHTSSGVPLGKSNERRINSVTMFDQTAKQFYTLTPSSHNIDTGNSNAYDLSSSWRRFSSTTGKMLTIRSKMGKFEVLKNGTLSIQRTNIKDHGQYICLAENEHGSDKLVVTLSVLEYPTRILEPKVREVKVLAGKTVEVECKTEGRPVPIVSWILPNHTEVKSPNTMYGRVAVSSKGTLTIQNVSTFDCGNYNCFASNMGSTDTVTVRLQVVAAPPLILEEKRQLVKADVGQNLFLPCSSHGDPQPNTHWVLHDGTIIRPLTSSHPKISVFINGTLHLRNVAITESGNYECVATSSTISERRVVTLSVKRTETAPQIIQTSSLKTELIYGGHLQLNCSAIGNPKPHIIWRLPSKALVDHSDRMGSRIKVLENGTLVVESVNEKDSGDFICFARSKAGDDVKLMGVSVSMKPARIEPNIFGKKQVPYGHDLKLDCVAAGVPIPEISWGLPDGTLVNSAVQSDGAGEFRSKRYTVFNNGTLYFNKVEIGEEGNYTCYAENKLGKDKMHVHINVLTAVPRIQPPNRTYAKVRPGGNIRFDCKATGEPKPKVLWMLPSKDIIAASNERCLVHANGSLDIRNVKLADAGEYVCTARNAAGEENQVYKLDIDGNPPIINGFKQNRTVVKEIAVKHSRKLIDCKVEGYPPPKITWIMPDNIFLTAPYYGSRINVHSNGTLEIRNVRPSDRAEFICMAQNDGGEAVMFLQLEVTGMLVRPIFKNPFNERLVTRVGRTAVLNCSADGLPAPEITWILPNKTRLGGERDSGSRYHLGKDGTLTIHYSRREDAGKYRCSAKNQVGYIEKLIVFEVFQKPYILTRPRGMIRCFSGEHLYLHCLTDGRKASISWIMPGGYALSRPQVSGRYHLMENGTLVIRGTTVNDGGNYVCQAKNEAGVALLTVPVIIMAFAPRIITGPPPAVRGLTGVPVYLPCVANGVPKPDIIWELPDHSVLTTTGNGPPVSSHLLHPHGTLVIQNPTRADSGNYKCSAVNILGRDTKITDMTVI